MTKLPPEMTNVPGSCTPFDEDLSGWLDGELPAHRAEALAAHVAGCARCRRRTEALRAVDERLRSLPARPVPPRLEADLLARVTAERRAAAPAARLAPRRRSRRLFALAAAAAAAAALLFWRASGPAPAPLAPPPAPTLASEIETASDEELAAALELETLQDFDVIANLDLLERALEAENGRG